MVLLRQSTQSVAKAIQHEMVLPNRMLRLIQLLVGALILRIQPYTHVAESITLLHDVSAM